MPNKRREGQTFIGCQADVELVAVLDQARGFKERSQFIRESIAEKLQRFGIRVPQNLIYPPPRAKSRGKSSIVPIARVADGEGDYPRKKK